MKTTNWKRFLSLLLALALVFGMSSVGVFAAEPYELRVLTFEDADYKGGVNYAGGRDWSSLIDSPQYGGSLLYPSSATTAYNWYDKGNTELAHAFADEWGDHQYWGGGHAISNYASGDVTTYGSYESQLTVFKKDQEGLARTGGGHNGSDNFAVHYGYVDNSGYSGTVQQSLYFKDNVARVIDHMYVNTTTYLLNCCVSGNDLTASIGESDWIKLIATGYNEDGNTTGTSEIYLVNGPDNIMMDWTKWDLSGLGAVVKVTFNVTGSSDNGYGFSQPAYFAYDDVAVRFESSSANTAPAVAEDAITEAETAVGTAWELDLAAMFTDADGDALTYTATVNGEAQTLDGSILRYTPAEAGTCTVVLTASDGEESATHTVTLTAVVKNRAPVLKEGVSPTKEDSTPTNYAYNLTELQYNEVFEDPDGDKLDYTSYYYQRSTDGGQTWGEEQHFTPSLFGFTTIQFTETAAGTYMYRFRAFDGQDYSTDTWTLTLHVSDDALQNIRFFVGQDHNYSANGNVYPQIKLYKTAGYDEELYDYVGYYLDEEGKPVYIYNPADYAISEDNGTYSVNIGDVSRQLYDYCPIDFTDSLFGAEGEDAVESGTVVENYNMYYASIPSGKYSYRAYGYNTETQAYDVYLGGQALNLPTEVNVDGGTGGGTDIYLRLISIYTTSKKTDGTYFGADDYTIEVAMPVMGGMVHGGAAYVSGNYARYPFMMYAAGNASLYNVYAYPTDTENYIFSQSINNTTAAGYTATTKTATINTAIALNVTVPADAEFTLFFQYNNFNTKAVEQSGETVVNDDGTVTIPYKVSKSNSNYTWRLVDPTGTYVTKAGWLPSITAETNKTYTFTSGDATDKRTHDESGLGTTVVNRDEADIQVFLTDSGYEYLTGTKRVRAYRLWQIINSDTANIMIEPEFNVQVLSGNADVVSQVSGGNADGNWLDVTPNGTSIVAVNYDAIDVYSTADAAGTHGGLFPATAPERTAVFVTSNTENGSADAQIAYNSNGTASSRGSNWDYNYDTWFYLSTDEAPTLDFTVSGSGDVTVQYAIVTTNSSLQSTQSDWTSISAGEDGSYHADLLGFRNAGTKGGTVIIKMTDSTGTSYRLARTAEVTVSIANVSYPNEPIMAGHEVSITFDGLYRGFDKYSGIFNPTNLYMYYTGDDETEFSATLSQYQRMDKIALNLTVPADFEIPEGETEAAYHLTNGYNYGSMYSAASPFTTLYTTMTDAGVGTNFNAVTVSFCMNRLPDIAVPVAETVYYNVAFDVKDSQGNAIDGCSITLKDSEGSKLTDEDGVYANVSYGTYDYEIACDGYITVRASAKFDSASVDAVSDGVITIPVVMEQPGAGAWDGASVSEPAKDEDGVYQIGTGAELAWFAQEVNGGQTAISAKLTSDIELAGYAWTPIGSSTNKYAGTFDGDGHIVKNLYINSASNYQGLFGYLSTGTITKLGVTGLVATTGNYAGGIVGYIAANSYITQCFNAANVTAAKWAGGIAGGAQGVTAYITDCYNTGKIKATGSAGFAGGIASCGTSVNLGAKITNCYNIGTVAGATKIGGVTASTGASNTANSFYLAGCCVGAANSGRGTAATADELKALAATLGESFADDAKGINGGYPILQWQAVSSVVYGDVDGDGTVSSTDAAMIYNLVNSGELTEEQITAADVNGDGTVNSTDAALIYRYANGKLTSFPVESN